MYEEESAMQDHNQPQEHADSDIFSGASDLRHSSHVTADTTHETHETHEGAAAGAIYDVIIIGGGPAGSACAMTLPCPGRTVLVLEKAAFPPFHLREPLLPFGTFVLPRLRLLDGSIASGAIVKRG